MQTIQLDIEDDNIDTKVYFHNVLKEIENGNDIPLSQKEYDNQMNEFIETL